MKAWRDWTPPEQRYARPSGPVDPVDACRWRDGNPFRDHPLTRYEWAWDRLAGRGRTGAHLDLGCNAGVFAAALSAAGVPVVGADVDRGMLRLLVDATGASVAVRVGPRDPLPFADASFDSASVLDVVEHVPDERALLREVARVVRPGGTILVTVPARHLFSFLDPDDAKLRTPALRRAVITLRRGRARFEEERARKALVPGMIGDLAVERPDHTNFTVDMLDDVLAAAGLRVVERCGSGWWYRWFQIPSLLLPGGPGRWFERLMVWDAHRFGGRPGVGARRRANLFVVAERPPQLLGGIEGDTVPAHVDAGAAQDDVGGHARERALGAVPPRSGRDLRSSAARIDRADHRRRA